MKNQAIRHYCGTIEELARKDQEEQKTTYTSEHYLGTPKIEEKDQEYEEEEEPEQSEQKKEISRQEEYEEEVEVQE